MADNPVGRPTKMTKEVVWKLEEAFRWNCNISEACLHANISRDTYYNYIKENPEFSDRAEELRNHPMLKARENVANCIESGDEKMTVWYIEKHEGKAKQQVDNVSSDGTMTPKNAINIDKEVVKEVIKELHEDI